MGPTAGMDDVEKKKFLTLPRLEPDFESLVGSSLVQRVASRHNDCTIPTP
jgi:hypothetical protein